MLSKTWKLLALGVFFAASACDPTVIVDGIGNVDNTDFVAAESFLFNIEVTTQTQFSLAGINGNVRVTGHPTATSITVAGERRVGSSSSTDARAHLPGLRVEVDERTDEIRVRTEQPEDTGGRNYVVDYVVTVPNSMAQVIGNVNGNITLTGVPADAIVANVNGNIDVTGVVGNLVVGLVNGNVTADVTLPDGDDVVLATVNGNLTLTVQAAVSAHLEAGWVNGGFSITGLTLTDQVVNQTSVSGTLGAGAGSIEMGLTNGQIAIFGRP
jgi:DUF4097 and DUF4098 domain-containing protein YvlB